MLQLINGTARNPKQYYPQWWSSVPSKARCTNSAIGDILFGGDMVAEIICLVCGKKKKVKPYQLLNAKFCGRKCYIENNVGGNNPRWKGGIYKSSGRFYVMNKSHPRANIYGYVIRARFVMEKSLNRYLKSKECVHHLNGKIDDDRIENLLILTNSEHSKLHGQNISDENRLKKSIAARGRKSTRETRLKLSIALKGRIFSEEHCLNISKAKKGKHKGELNPNYKHGGYISG